MKITINKHTFTKEEIVYYPPAASLSQYEKQTLQFLKAWFHDQSVFKQQTSGSTGIPKSIPITRKQMEASAKMTLEHFQLTTGDHFLNPLNINYIGGKMMLVRAALLNTSITITEPLGNPLSALHEEPDTFDFAAFAPLQLQKIIEANPYHIRMLNNMKAIIIGGAPVSSYQEHLFRKIETPVYHTYGMTETVSHIAMRKINNPEHTNEYQVLPSITITSDDRGCLKLKGPVTNNRFIQTNDVVTLTGRNTFIWQGRYDNIINSGGIKIMPETLEKTIDRLLQAEKYHLNFFLYGIPDPALGEKMIMIAEAPGINENDLIKMLKHYLPAYQVPKRIFGIETFEKTASGKTDKAGTMRKINIQ